MEATNNASLGLGSNQQRGERGTPTASPEGNECPGLIKVTLIVQNQIKEEFFKFEETVTKPPGTPLIRYLESAADHDKRFKFNATYFPSPLGYFIESINGLAGMWKILGTDGQPLKLGVSSYVPGDGEKITFEFTKSNK